MKGFRPTLARTVNSMQKINNVKGNAVIRDIEEEEGELEEKEGIIVSIKRDLINGAGWTVKDKDGKIYTCSCATSMYELPETVERGGILYPKEDIKVVFTINPVLRINIIKEIKTSDKENQTLDISKFQHGDEPTTVIAKPKSALSISDGLITINYNNDNQVIANSQGVSTEGKDTQINTDKFSINSNDISIKGKTLAEILEDNALGVSNAYKSFDLPTLDELGLIADRSNNMTQLHINGALANQPTVIGEIRDQQSIPVREQTQLITDGNCIDIIKIDTNGVISVTPAPNSPCPEKDTDGNIIKKNINFTINFITPQIQSRNYIEVVVKQMCDYCDNGNNASMEYVNYCPSCQNWNTLVDTGTSIRCNCGTQYCQNCGREISGSSLKLRKYLENSISAYGTTCSFCNTQLQAGTTKQYINYCPDCQSWGTLSQGQDHITHTINVLRCSSCESEYCSSCGINQQRTGITLSKNPVQYEEYKNALRKLKYVKDGA